MTDQKRIVLDANILLRAVFGVRVRSFLETYEDSVSFFAPDICFVDARKYVPTISEKRRIDPVPGIQVLDHLSHLIEVVDKSLYEEYETSARERMISRDEEDWPIVASALLLSCPIWTEDRDFFGSGLSLGPPTRWRCICKERTERALNHCQRDGSQTSCLSSSTSGSGLSGHNTAKLSIGAFHRTKVLMLT